MYDGKYKLSNVGLDIVSGERTEVGSLVSDIYDRLQIVFGRSDECDGIGKAIVRPIWMKG